MHRLPDNMTDRTVCILGMGFVGVTLAAVMAQIGFDVVGVDVRPDLVRRLRAGEAHFFEPGLTDQTSAAVRSGRLTAYEQIPEDCGASVHIVTVGTPLGLDGRVDLTSITAISRQLAERLKDGDLVLLRSTVRIGVTRQLVAPILRASGKQFDLAFCPERTVEGQAMAELRVLPQIIGADNFVAGLRAARLFQHITPTVVRVSDIETAEMIKLVDNSTRDLTFAYANEVARMCDVLGISVDEVIRSGRFGYSRSGLPKPGPVGGPSLSKDSHILCESMEAFGLDSDNLLEPDAVACAVEYLSTHPEQAVVYGSVRMISAEGGEESVYRPGPYDFLRLVTCELVPPWSTSFFNRPVCGPSLRLDPQMKTCADFDIWLRLSHLPIAFLDKVAGSTRLSANSMTCRPESYEPFCRDKAFALKRYAETCTHEPLRAALIRHGMVGIYCWAAESLKRFAPDRTDLIVDYFKRASAVDPDSARVAVAAGRLFEHRRR